MSPHKNSQPTVEPLTHTRAVTPTHLTKVEGPYGPSHFVLRKTGGKDILFLISTGCTTNMLSHHIFDRLS